MQENIIWIVDKLTQEWINYNYKTNIIKLKKIEKIKLHSLVVYHNCNTNNSEENTNN